MKGAVFCAPFIYDLLSKSFWYISLNFINKLCFISSIKLIVSSLFFYKIIMGTSLDNPSLF